MRASEEDVASTLSETVQFIIADTGPFTIAGYTGDEDRFRSLLEAYTVLRDPEQRARYDVLHQQRRKDRGDEL